MDQLLWNQARLRTALTDEALHTLGRLANDEDRAVDHLEKEWNQPVETERPDGVTTITRVTDLNRMFDLNNLSAHRMTHTRPEATRMLNDLMIMTGDFAPVDRIESLTDWVSTTNTGARKSEFYLQKDPPYRTPDTPLHTWSELLWAQGFDKTYFERKPLYQIARPFSENLIDLACIIPGPYERPMPININTAPRAVLEAVLGPDRDMLVRYIELARLDQPYRSIDALLALADPGYLQDVRPFLDVRSTFFLVEVRGFAAEHRAHLRVVAQRDTEGIIRIRQWVM
jgi:type II secretory pathway component PulK